MFVIVQEIGENNTGYIFRGIQDMYVIKYILTDRFKKRTDSLRELGYTVDNIVSVLDKE